MRRQPAGDAKGSKPSITSTSAMASQKLSLSTTRAYLRVAAAPCPRMVLKNSDEAGSSTMMSLLEAKLAL